MPTNLPSTQPPVVSATPPVPPPGATGVSAWSDLLRGKKFIAATMANGVRADVED